MSKSTISLHLTFSLLSTSTSYYNCSNLTIINTLKSIHNDDLKMTLPGLYEIYMIKEVDIREHGDLGWLQHRPLHAYRDNSAHNDALLYYPYKIPISSLSYLGYSLFSP